MTQSDIRQRIETTLSHWQRGAGVIALVGFAGCVVAWFTAPVQFCRSYLFGYLFWWATTMGCLGILMLQYLVGGRWGAASKSVLQCGSALIPLVALLFVPIAFSLHLTYPWASENPESSVESRGTNPDTPSWSSGAEFSERLQAEQTGSGLPPHRHEDSHAKAMANKIALYLNPPFFYGRTIGYFLLWTLLTILLRHRDPELPAQRPEGRRRVSAGGLVLLILTVTFAAIDWAMSVDPAWFSSIYGALVVIGGALAAIALVAFTLATLATHQTENGILVLPKTLGDLGSLMLAFLMLWAYFGFSQFLIIWSGNLPEENTWYVTRLNGGWQWLGLAIVVLQFFVPFFLLLSRRFKQTPATLARIAALVFLMQLVYLFWSLSPSFHPGGFYFHWVDLAAPLAIGGVWISFYVWKLKQSVVRQLKVETGGEG